MIPVLIGVDAYERLTAVAHARNIPVEVVVAEMLDDWHPTVADAKRAIADGPVAQVWIGVDVHDRLKQEAKRRGVTMMALADEALAGVGTERP